MTRPRKPTKEQLAEVERLKAATAPVRERLAAGEKPRRQGIRGVGDTDTPTPDDQPED